MEPALARLRQGLEKGPLEVIESEDEYLTLPHLHGRYAGSGG
jgi:hypothetical protein